MWRFRVSNSLDGGIFYSSGVYYIRTVHPHACSCMARGLQRTKSSTALWEITRNQYNSREISVADCRNLERNHQKSSTEINALELWGGVKNYGCGQILFAGPHPWIGRLAQKLLLENQPEIRNPSKSKPEVRIPLEIIMKPSMSQAKIREIKTEILKSRNHVEIKVISKSHTQKRVVADPSLYG